jgi:RimJ/RimL family protein N-acetyltransferase
MRDPEIYRYTPYRPPETLVELEETLRRRATRTGPPGDRWFNWTPLLRATGEPLGNVQLTTLPDGDALLGYFLLRHAWGRGYAREACSAVISYARDAVRTRTLVAEIDVRNVASARLAGALGFTLAGVAPFDGPKGLCDEARYELALNPPK